MEGSLPQRMALNRIDRDDPRVWKNLNANLDLISQAIVRLDARIEALEQQVAELRPPESIGHDEPTTD